MGLQSTQNFHQPFWMLCKEKDFNKENSNQGRTSFNLFGCCGKNGTLINAKLSSTSLDAVERKGLQQRKLQSNQRFLFTSMD
ncbi:Hypothetical protein SRAE_X000239900 [Strongyloides ratti]|uniref:Uncharacterized protein n=1 Tax=Strongyloides ratti TaxID=34506 RepID=A0A090KTE2_STRRB|nr:Hypothetical protein SRAE_X000239900 [Strongyloides ratti]CEF60666.1 Hypothetical protein SRAE_X000239900 [Strongyloides ratti]